ncbi:MAG: pilus assembly protein N-terminal domain-containing protein [bacterium]|nr:pilus assembly protein N-terminal domain-containing protein [bacterium]
MMKRYLWLVILVLVPFSALADEWVIETGDSMVLQVPNLEKMAIGDPKIADVVVVSPNELLINGIHEGRTSLHIWTKNTIKKHTIQVIERKFPLQEISTVKGLENVTASFVGKSLVLKGVVKNQHEKQQAEILANAFNDWVINLIQVEEPLQVLVNLQVINISSKDWLQLGSELEGNSQIEGRKYKGNTSGFREGLNIGLVKETSFLPNFTLKIEALKEKGKAKTLSSPSLLTLSGKEAYVNVGGKIPIPITVIQNQTTSNGVEWIDYGIQLKIIPLADLDNNINLKINSSISEPDWTKMVNGIPAMTSKNVLTEVNVKSKDTVILSGLTEVKKSTTNKRVPVLGRIPVLGAFFSSKTVKEDEMELIVIITPEIVTSGTSDKLLSKEKTKEK